MRILHTIPGRNWGGLEFRVIEQTQWLNAHGHQAWLATPKNGESHRRAVAAGLPVIDFNFGQPWRWGTIRKMRALLLELRIEVADVHVTRDAKALIALMAQMGCFVPAKAAKLPLFDRIFTRVGASDSLTRGQSTFMVEMTEAASILNNATQNSLVILDEIGRGTSTLDGISLAWAIVEHLHRLGALTLFATHYHELVRLEEELKGVSNAKVVVKEEGEKIVFLKKVVAGQADKSYGIHVAELAGLPRSVLSLAKGILNRLEYAQARLAESLDHNPGLALESQAEPVNQQISFAPVEAPWVEELRSFDLNHKTPLEALQLVHRLQQKL